MKARTFTWLRPTAALRSALYAIADAISPKSPPHQGLEKSHLAQLRADASASSLRDADGTTINDDWAQNLATLRRHILNDDPAEFLRWPMIMRTMFVGLRLYVLRELWFLRKRGWLRWRKAIRESTVGRPYRFPLSPASSGNLIHYAYHLANFEEVAGTRSSDLDLILEFGGGYGGMCRVIHNAGFEGRYVIFDLPLFSALQRYFLQMNGLSVAQYPRASTAKDVLCISDLESLQAALNGLPSRGKFMLLAAWSLSEAPVQIRNVILNMTDKFRFFLIGYQGRFAGLDNGKFFADWAARRTQMAWTFRGIRHFRGFTYLIGGAQDSADE